MKIKGKQIAINTITQDNLSLTTPSGNTDAATKEYVDSMVSVEHLSLANKDMVALSTTGITGYTLACNIPVLENPLSNSQVIVYVNNVQVDQGPLKWCYFSGNSGMTARNTNEVAWGDFLYWNKQYAPYDLEPSDKIDFVYLIHGDSVEEGTLDYVDGGWI